jgi:DNA-binding transcriptional regulator YiaG
MFLGTHRDNMHDMSVKGMAAHGIRVKHARLTDKDIREIRARYASEDITQKELALLYGVKRSAISKITLRNAWRHIE